MKLLESKTLCIVIMVLLMVSGFILGGWKGLNTQYNKVEDVFFLGVEKDGICAANDMAERSVNLINMITIARKYIKSEDVIDQAVKAGNRFEGSKEIQDMFNANKDMDTAMEGLYRAMNNMTLSQKDEKYRQRLYADFNSANDRISHDPYYTYASDYNKMVRKFPANLIISLTPVEGAVISY